MQNHQFSIENYAQAAMLESLVGGREDSPSSLKSHQHLGTRFHSSRNETGLQMESTPRQDSTYFSNKDPQEQVLEDLDTKDQLGSSLQKSTKAVKKSRKFTSSPPPITSTVDDDAGSEINAEILAKQMRARERVGILRGRVLRTRRMVKGQRVELQRRREDVGVAIDKLARKITELETLDEIDGIFSYQEALRTSRDRLGPVEEEYDRLEIRLENEEFDLEEEEDYFYRHHDASLVVPESKLDTVISPRAHAHTPLQEEITDLELEDGLVQEYFDKIAEATRLKEELDELESDFSRLSEDADFRRRHSILMPLDVPKFFEEYSGLRADLVEKILEVEDEIFDLRDRCLGKGLFANDEYPYEYYRALCEYWMEPVYYTQDRSPLRVAVERDNSCRRDLDYGDKKDCVNSWLLEWTQDSAVHILMLKADIFFYFPQNYKVTSGLFNIENWADLALDNWHQDGAGEFANANYNASRLDQISGSLHKIQGTSTTISRRCRESSISDYQLSLNVEEDDDDGALVRTIAGSNMSVRKSPEIPLIKRRFSI